MILGLGLVSFAAFALLYAQNQSLAYFSMPTRFWELAAGGALFIMLERRSAEMTPARRAMPGLGLLGLAVAYAAPGTLAVPATVLAVAATLWLLTYVRPGTATYRLLTTALLVRIGVISYSLYLWHWSVIVVARYTVGVSLTTIPLLVLLMTALAAASYKYVESPLRVATWHRLRRGSIAYGLAASAAGAVLIVSLARPLAGALYLGAQPELEATGTASLGSPVVDSRDGSVWSGEACALASPDDVGKRIPVGPCTFGNPVNASQRILVVGNSYSTAFAAAYELLASQHDVAITLTSSWGASALPQLPNTSPFAASNAYYWSSVVPELSAHLEKGDILLIASDLTDLSPASRTDFDEEQLARLSRGIDSISTELRSRGAHLAILGGLPFAREAYCAPVQAIPQWFAPGQGPCIYRSRTETMERLAPLQRTMEALRASAGLLVIDLMPIFCPGETCSYFAADGQLLYRDEWSHPSIEAARLSVKTFERELPLAPLQ